MEIDHEDRVTGEIKDTKIQLSTDGKDHADRYDNPILPDDTKQNTILNTAYYYNLTTRIANGAHPSLTNNTLEEAQAQGFFSKDYGANK